MSKEKTDTKPVSISFKQHRDEEIVGFFANEHRVFRPENTLPPDDDFGRSRIVHPPEPSRPTAAFRTAIQTRLRAISEKSKMPILREESEKMVPLPEDMIQVNESIRQAVQEAVSKRVRKQRLTVPEPSFGKSTRPLSSVFLIGQQPQGPPPGRAAKIIQDPLKQVDPNKPTIQKSPHFETRRVPKPQRQAEENRCREDESIIRLTETDVLLQQLIESWPKIPLQLRETIATLIDDIEKE